MALRLIDPAEVREAMEELALLDVSDGELAESGAALTEEAELVDGLGPSRYAYLELPSGEQYLVHRLLYAPYEGVNLVATLTADAPSLVAAFMDAAELPSDRVRHVVDDWDDLLKAYHEGGRDRWLARRRGGG
jgi:hypothetical protein